MKNIRKKKGEVTLVAVVVSLLGALLINAAVDDIESQEAQKKVVEQNK